MTPEQETVSTWRVDPPEPGEARPADTYDVVDGDGFAVVLTASNMASVTLSNMTFEEATGWLAAIRKGVGLS